MQRSLTTILFNLNVFLIQWKGDQDIRVGRDCKTAQGAKGRLSLIVLFILSRSAKKGRHKNLTEGVSSDKVEKILLSP